MLFNKLGKKLSLKHTHIYISIKTLILIRINKISESESSIENK